MNGRPVVLPSPDLVAALTAAGRSMRPLREIVGEGLLVGFSDYVERGRYATSTLYLTTQQHWKALSNRLQAIRASMNVASAVLQYKNRKKWARFWPSAIEPWLVSFREIPGISVCIAYSKEFFADPEHAVFRRETQRSFEIAGKKTSAAVAIASVPKLLPFVLLAPQLDGATLGWTSDRDAMLEGVRSTELLDSLLTMFEQAGSNVSIVHPTYGDRLPWDSEAALSLPDVASGVVAKLLPHPFTPVSISRDGHDETGFALLACLAQMGSPFESEGPPGKLHVAVLDQNRGESRLLPIALAAHGRSSAPNTDLAP